MKSLVSAVFLVLAFQSNAEARRDEPVLLVMNRVVNRIMPKILAQKESPRLVVGDGKFGLGILAPFGGDREDFKATPLSVIPRAAMGRSLNLDPATGHLWPLY
jgi:hypothetical protein